MLATISSRKHFPCVMTVSFRYVQDLMARLNPKLLVTQVATGEHVDGGYTVHWVEPCLLGRPAAHGRGCGRPR